MLTSYIKINSKQITELNLRSRTETISGEIVEDLYGLGLNKEFSDMTPKAQSIKSTKIDKSRQILILHFKI